MPNDGEKQSGHTCICLQPYLFPIPSLTSWPALSISVLSASCVFHSLVHPLCFPWLQASSMYFLQEHSTRIYIQNIGPCGSRSCISTYVPWYSNISLDAVNFLYSSLENIFPSVNFDQLSVTFLQIFPVKAYLCKSCSRPITSAC